MNFYVLFTHTHLSKQQKVVIRNVDSKPLSECEGEDDPNFCPPVILLENSFILQIPRQINMDDDLQVVIVSTSEIPFYYYAYSRLPAWAAVVTVITLFVFLFLMTTLCCCCILMMCRRQQMRQERTISAGHGRRRNAPNGSPVYSPTSPVLFDLPPIYVVPEAAPLPEKSAPPAYTSY